MYFSKLINIEIDKSTNNRTASIPVEVSRQTVDFGWNQNVTQCKCVINLAPVLITETKMLDREKGLKFKLQPSESLH